MRALELKVPPPVIGLVLAILMWWISTQTASQDVATATVNQAVDENTHLTRVAGSIVTALIGIAFDVAGLMTFLKLKTTVNPLRPGNTAVLATDGVYRITRNPMYLGMLLLLIAWTLYLAAPWAVVGPLLFFAWISRFQIAPEERVLADKFGTAFEEYRRRVRRWI